MRGSSRAQLPVGVVREWARWGTSGDWLFSHVPDARERFAAFRAPLVAYGAWDDPIAPPSSVDALLACFTGTRAKRIAIERGDLPAPSVGHLGLFRRVPGASVWPQFERFVLECARPRALPCAHATRPAHIRTD